MATQPPENNDTNDDAEFDAEMKRLADKRDGLSPNPEPPAPSPAPSEENAPEGEPAPEAAPAPPDDDGTSGQPATSDGAKPPPVVEASDDRWKDVPDNIRTQIAAIEKERDEARHKAKSDAERVQALSRKLHSLTSADKPAPAKEVEPTEAQKALDAKVTQLREDYPEVAEPVLELLAAQRAELSKVTTKLETVEEDRKAQFVAQQEALLTEVHPDWQQIAGEDRFKEWVAAQPEGIQNLTNSYDARETSTVLTLYKMEVEAASQGEGRIAPTPEQVATEARRREQLNGGVAIKTRAAPVTSGPPDDFEGAALYYEAKKDRELEAARRR